MKFSIGIEIDESGNLKFITSTDSERRQREKGKSLLLLPNDYTVIDIETTGLDSCFCDIIEMGVNGKINCTDFRQ